MYRSFTLRMLLLLTVVGLSVGVAASVAAAASGSAWPQTASPGVRVHFSATGFTPNERVDFWASAPNGRAYPRYPSVNADPSGAVVWSWDVAAGAINGAWAMSARGISSDSLLTIPFSVTGSSAVASTLTVTPASAPPDTSFTFHDTGLTPGILVSAWLVDPAGASRDLVPGKDPNLVPDASGELIWSWLAPRDTVGGTWQLVVRDGATHDEQRVSFRIEMPARAPIRTLTPPNGAPGTRFTVTVDGFTPGEQVGSWLVAPDGRSFNATPYMLADGQGAVTWRWDSPSGAQAGTWQAVTHGTRSAVEVVLRLTITGNNAAPSITPQTASGSVSPTSASAGASFTFTINGFSQVESVGYWPTQPDGTVERTTRIPLGVDGDGHAVLIWEAPAQAQHGNWTMSFKGITSDRMLTVPFKIGVVPVVGVSVSPLSGGPGTTFTFTANGFNVIEWLDTWLDRPDGTQIAGPGGARADGQGASTWTWTAPVDTAGGPWVLVVKGVDSGVTYRLPFTILRSDAPPAVASVTPTTGAAGTTFTFTASGYIEDEMVGYWLNLPDGSIQSFEHELSANKAGQVTWVYTAPANAPKGTYVMAVRSSQGDRVANDVSYALRFTVK